MDLLELQQRANIIVNNVNAYEENLVGTELDESVVLDQHKYADLYCLRPVMKLLFGSSISEKLNRTLDNDVALRVFASTAPAWNSTFNLLSYKLPGDDIKLHYSDAYVEQPDGWLKKLGTSGTTLSSAPFRFTKTTRFQYSYNDTTKRGLKTLFSMEFNNYDIVRIDSDNYKSDDTSTFTIYNYDYYAGIISTSYALDKRYYEYIVDVTITPRESQKLDIVINIVDLNTGRLLLSHTKQITYNFASGNNALYIVDYLYDGWETNPKLNYLKATYDSQDVGYESSQHQFVQNLDMMNKYNMMQLDTYHNTKNSRDTRIKNGINYLYSANIQDALVTESQIANIFNWNTTEQNDTSTNSMTVASQVPGIVCYYLGNDYNNTYTATMSENLGKLNSVAYNKPTIYGAYYTTNPNTSQIQDYKMDNKAALRVFIPSTVYTSGRLISPQQIWQPDKRVGEANNNLGYNWQGGAVYSELVFKGKREDTSADFVPTLDSVADNDPQGFATRFALAQQKPYYKNRPWFNELDELYGKNQSKFANYIINKSTTAPEPVSTVVANNEILDVVGTPTIDTTTGVMTNISDSNCLTLKKEFVTSNCTIILCFEPYHNSVPSGKQYKMMDANTFVSIYQEGYSFYSYNTTNGTGGARLINTPDVSVTQKYYVKYVISNGAGTIYDSKDGINYVQRNTMQDVRIPTTNPWIGRGRDDNEYWHNKIYLDECSIQRSTDVEPIKFTSIEMVNQKEFNKNLFELVDNPTLSDTGILSNLNGSNYASLSELNLDIPEDLDDLMIYLPEFTLSNNAGSHFNYDTYNFSILFDILHDNGNIYPCGFEVTLSKSTSTDEYAVSGSSYSNGTQALWSKSYFKSNSTGYKVKLRAVYSTPITNVGNIIQFTNVELQYLDYSSNTWKSFSRALKHNQVYIDFNKFKSCTIGRYLTESSIFELEDVDLTQFRITANNNSYTLFETMTTPGEHQMNDTEFYNKFKLDWNTFKNGTN